MQSVSTHMFKREHRIDKNNNNTILCILSDKKENKKFSLFAEMVNYRNMEKKKTNIFLHTNPLLCVHTNTANMNVFGSPPCLLSSFSQLMLYDRSFATPKDPTHSYTH